MRNKSKPTSIKSAELRAIKRSFSIAYEDLKNCKKPSADKRKLKEILSDSERCIENLSSETNGSYFDILVLKQKTLQEVAQLIDENRDIFIRVPECFQMDRLAMVDGPSSFWIMRFVHYCTTLTDGAWQNALAGLFFNLEFRRDFLKDGRYAKCKIAAALNFYATVSLVRLVASWIWSWTYFIFGPGIGKAAVKTVLGQVVENAQSEDEAVFAFEEENAEDPQKDPEHLQ